MDNLSRFINNLEYLVTLKQEYNNLAAGTFLTVFGIYGDTAKCKVYYGNTPNTQFNVPTNILSSPIESKKDFNKFPLPFKKDTPENQYSRELLLQYTKDDKPYYAATIFSMWALDLDQHPWTIFKDEEGKLYLGVNYLKITKTPKTQIINQMQIKLLQEKFRGSNIKIGRSVNIPQYPKTKFYALS